MSSRPSRTQLPISGIWGAGAVGHMLAYAMTGAMLPVQLWARHGRLTQAQRVLGPQGPRSMLLDESLDWPQLWWVTVKAHQLDKALAELLPRCQPASEIIILANGYIENIVAPWRQAMPELVLKKGVVTKGVRQQENGSYEVGSSGSVVWEGSEASAELAELLAPLGFKVEGDVCRLRREKWYFNTCLNTYCAVHTLDRNGHVLQKNHLSELQKLAREVAALAQELWPFWQQNRLWEKLMKLVVDTQSNENSMAADVRLGRMTEREFLSGLVLQAASPEAYPLLLKYDSQLALSPEINP